MKNGWKLVLGVAMGVIAAYYGGAIFDFFPFLASELQIRVIGFCTLIVCVVMAVCTYLIISEIKRNRSTDAEKEE